MLCTGGDDHLGGDDFDKCVYDIMMREWKQDMEDFDKEECDLENLPNHKRRAM